MDNSRFRRMKFHIPNAWKPAFARQWKGDYGLWPMTGIMALGIGVVTYAGIRMLLLSPDTRFSKSERKSVIPMTHEAGKAYADHSLRRASETMHPHFWNVSDSGLVKEQFEEVDDPFKELMREIEAEDGGEDDE